MTSPQFEEDDLERSCPACGAVESQWAGVDSKGFAGKDGEVYCCEACSSGRACGCNPERSESLVKKRSA